MRALASLVLAVIFVVPGCAEAPAGSADAGSMDGSSPDARDARAAGDDALPDSDLDARGDGGPLDAGPEDDAPVLDAGADASAGDDAGAGDAATADDAPATDGGAQADGGPIDGGVGADGGTASDGGVPSDGGGSTFDAPITTCSIVISPMTASTDDDFDAMVTSNGSGCSVRFDAGAPTSVPCRVDATFPGSFFGVGSHTVELLVSDGPAGATSCSTSFTVTAAPDAGPVDAGPPITTCAVSVDPPSGTTADTFTLTVASNGSACTVSVDGAAPISLPCNADFPSRSAAGSHVVVLSVGAGPGGPTMCSATVEVTEAPDAGAVDAGPPSGVTTCTIDVTPSSGSGATTFTVTTNSNGTTCTVSVDGSGPISAPCSGSFTTMGSILPAGSHTIELSVGAGPGGPTTCSDTFTITP